MALPTVHIRREALLSMIFLASDVFKKECLGFLLGYRPTKKRNYFLITDVVSFSNLTVRSYTEADWSRRTKQRFRRFIALINPLRIKHLGDLHSHPEYGGRIYPPVMSDIDIENIVKNNHDLGLIISISSRQKGQAAWESLSDGSLKGSFDKFNFDIKVYTLLGEDGAKEPQWLQIVAPEATEALNIIQARK